MNAPAVLRNVIVAIATAAAVFGQATAPAPEWQTSAGGKMSFEVASIKPSKEPFTPPNFPLDNGDAYRPVGDRFSADFPLVVYIMFAYKIRLTGEQLQAMLAPLPKWVSTDRFSIQAHGGTNPTKDQMRLMMQSLLADRFQLAVHFESREVPLLALELVKSGKTGPKLRPHSEGPACDAPAGADVFPPICDVQALTMRNGVNRAGSRNSTIELLAAGLPTLGRLGRPVVDRTRLTGKFDYTLEWTPEPNSPPSPNAEPPPDVLGPTFLEALRDQLGLKLESTKGPLQTLVVDHVERPSEN